VNGAEEDRENFCKGLDGQLLFSALYGTYMVTMNELKASAQARQSGVAKKSSVKSTAQTTTSRKKETQEAYLQ
jgi:hypothetical protein